MACSNLSAAASYPRQFVGMPAPHRKQKLVLNQAAINCNQEHFRCVSGTINAVQWGMREISHRFLTSPDIAAFKCLLLGPLVVE
jgi:hypothetical protein